ncbi:LysR family transcriptional regulator [Limnobaculum parvum]|uniref:LysR family transcriptional regulator n=1 Tax=Limnobaculum parvum TaxID=2172103 RepID=A0A2Y9TZ65_9GAMM|nr:LysR family transcriptional regulator [Limnobaculum parvum]AWH89058.1 LysR family transcriptional regulator [Limnobaculum parvum]
MQNKLEMLRIFYTVAESRNFKDAAILLGISPQAVTRAVKELEQQRGEILFYRSTRQMKITADGERLAQYARQAVNAIDGLLMVKPQQKSDEMRGTVRLTVSSVFGRKFIIPALTQFSLSYPNIVVDCTLTDTHSDVIDERIDIGIRFGFLPNNRYVARELAKIHFFSVGAPELVNKIGIPKNIDELDSFPLTALIDHKTGRYWPWNFKDTRSFTPSNPRFITDDVEAEFQAVLDGVGFGHIPSFLAQPYLNSGRLVQILEDNASSSWGLYLYRPQRGPTSLRIRTLFDYLAEFLSQKCSL